MITRSVHSRVAFLLVVSAALIVATPGSASAHPTPVHPRLVNASVKDAQAGNPVLDSVTKQKVSGTASAKCGDGTGCDRAWIVNENYHLCSVGGCTIWNQHLTFRMFYSGTGGNGHAWGVPAPRGYGWVEKGFINCAQNGGVGFSVSVDDCQWLNCPAHPPDWCGADVDFHVSFLVNGFPESFAHYMHFHLYSNGVARIKSG